jgi:hypothetical protein
MYVLRVQFMLDETLRESTTIYQHNDENPMVRLTKTYYRYARTYFSENNTNGQFNTDLSYRIVD